MNYFGTDLKSPGHYLWNLIEDKMQKSTVPFKDIPFDPYDGQKPLPKGTVTHLKIGEFSVFVISGSVADNRGGTLTSSHT